MLRTCTYRAIHWESDQQEVSASGSKHSHSNSVIFLMKSCIPVCRLKQGKKHFSATLFDQSAHSLQSMFCWGIFFSWGEEVSFSNCDSQSFPRQWFTMKIKCLALTMHFIKQIKQKQKQTKKKTKRFWGYDFEYWVGRNFLQQKFCFLVKQYIFLMAALWFMWFMDLRETGQIRVACATQSSYAVPLIIMN